MFTKTFTVERLTDEDDIYYEKETYIPNGEIKGALVPISAEDVMLSDGNPSKSSKLIAELGTDLKETDRVTINGKKYTVKGIQIFDYGIGSLGRIEAIIEELNS